MDLSRAEAEYGSLSAAALTTFISDAQAFENVQELLDYPAQEIKILPDDSLSVLIGADYGATLVVAAKRFDRDAMGRVIWSSVTRLKLVTMSRVP